MKNIELKLNTYTRFHRQQISALKVVHHADEVISEHHHNYSELVVVQTGNGYHVLNGIMRPIYPGQVILIHPRQRHYYTKFTHLTLLTFLFTPDVLRPFLADLMLIPSFRTFFGEEERKNDQFFFIDGVTLSRLDAIADRIIQEQLEVPPGFTSAITCLFLEAILHLVRTTRPVSADYAAASNRLAPALSYLEKNFSHEITLQQLAEISGMSVSNFRKFFKEMVGTSPIQYLLRVRMKNAVALLLDSSLSITDIAQRSGFNDTNYFTKVFTRIHGLPPRVYRKMDHGILHIPEMEESPQK